MSRSPGPCRPGKEHRFAAASGWCLNGCGWRDDGASAYHRQADQRREASVIDITQPRRQS